MPTSPLNSSNDKPPGSRLDLGTTATHNAGICFIVMPFGGHFDEYYRLIYAPAISEAGLRPVRADDLFRPGTIIKDVWDFTRTAVLILADLSTQSPNVYYELGLAHAIAKPAILITDSLASVPFDLRSLRVLTYTKDDPEWGAHLRGNITAAIAETINSPVSAVLPAFLQIRSDAGVLTVTDQEKTQLEIRKDLESLRNELRIRHSPRDSGGNPTRGSYP